MTYLKKITYKWWTLIVLVLLATPAMATVPSLQSASLSSAGNTLVLIYDIALNESSVPVTGDFSLTASAGGLSATSVVISTTTVTVSLDRLVGSSETVTLDYSATGNPIKDAGSSDEAAAISNQALTNNSAEGIVVTLFQGDGPGATNAKVLDCDVVSLNYNGTTGNYELVNANCFSDLAEQAVAAPDLVFKNDQAIQCEFIGPVKMFTDGSITAQVGVGCIANDDGSGGTDQDADNDTKIEELFARTSFNDQNDQLPSVSLSITGSSSIQESGGSTLITASLDNSAISDVDVTVTITPTSAYPDADYTLSNLDIVIPAGANSASITFTATEDAEVEGDETISLDITGVLNASENPSPQQVQVTINDNDYANVTLSVTPSSVAENGGVATITATRDVVTGDNIFVYVVVSPSSTAEVGDYGFSESESGGRYLIRIDSGATGSMTMTANDDGAGDVDNEIVNVEIDEVINGTYSAPQSVAITINDDEGAPTNCPASSSGDVDAQIDNHVFASSENCIASNSINTPVTVTTVGVNNGVTVNFEAPVISLKAGFSVAAGGLFCAGQSGDCIAAARSVDTIEKTVIVADDTEDAVASGVYGAIRLTADNLPSGLSALLNQANADVTDVFSDAQGLYVVFATTSGLSNLDANGQWDIYFYDVTQGSLDLLSVNAAGRAGNGDSRQPRIDGGGNYVVFSSDADDLGNDDSNGVADIYITNLVTGLIERVSFTENGEESSYSAQNPALASDRPYILYDRVDGDGFKQVYGYDYSWTSSSAEILSLETDETGAAINNHHAAVSADGEDIVYLETVDGESDWNNCSVHLYNTSNVAYQRLDCPTVFEQDAEYLPFINSDDKTIEWVGVSATGHLTEVVAETNYN